MKNQEKTSQGQFGETKKMASNIFLKTQTSQSQIPKFPKLKRTSQPRITPQNNVLKHPGAKQLQIRREENLSEQSTSVTFDNQDLNTDITPSEESSPEEALSADISPLGEAPSDIYYPPLVATKSVIKGVKSKKRKHMDISLARENRDPNIVVIDEDNQNVTDDNCSFEFGVKKKRKKDKLPERENGGPTVIDDEGIRMEQHQKSSKKVKSANLPMVTIQNFK